VAHEGVVYAVPRGTVMAVRAGGRDDVTTSHRLWRVGQGSNVPSPVYHQGHLYFANEDGVVYCLDANTGERVYQERLSPAAGQVYASPVLAEGRLYYVSRSGHTYIVAAKPTFEQLAHNDLSDGSIFNASPAVSNGQLLLRSDKFLYCIGQ
jgi:outer membrane protein assembly factor BamB